MDRFEIWENIYQDAVSKVKVVKGWDRKLKVPVALKIRSGEDPRMLQVYQHEADTHADLDHPNVCRFFTSFLQNTGKEHQFVIAMELVSTDLNKEIERRWPNTHWSEAQLWRFLTQITEALCYLQEKENVKLGDFGASREAAGTGDFTLQGSPLYLSPLLRLHLAEQIRTATFRTPRHNPYKSDVYSLGVTFVHMMMLEKPSNLASTKDLSARISDCLTSLNCSWKFRMTLKLMLKEKEEDRPDCLQLLEFLRSVQVQPGVLGPFCLLCGGSPQESVALFCNPEEHRFCSFKCFRFFVACCLQVDRIPLSGVRCPFCPAESIPEAYILELFEGEVNLRQFLEGFLRQREVCSECRLVGQILRITDCEHQFCSKCIGGWKKYFREERRKCPMCMQPLLPEARHWLAKRCLLL